jgi:hypothetical protein
MAAHVKDSPFGKKVIPGVLKWEAVLSDYGYV